MKRVLIIEDDPFVAGLYRSELTEAGFTVDVASTGDSAMELFNSQRPDLVLLDLMLPDINGLEVLERIRSTADPRDLPVLVFTNAYLGGMVQQAWELGANLVLTKTGHTPKQMVQLIEDTLKEPRPRDPVPGVHTAPSESTSAQTAWFRTKFFQAAPRTRFALKRTLRALATDPTNQGNIHQLYAKAHPFASMAALAGLQPVARMAEAFEGFLKELVDKRAPITPSVLLTIAHAIETLDFLVENHEVVALHHPYSPRILVVDDDAFVGQAVCAALEKVNLKAVWVDSPAGALQRLAGDSFDLIFLDIEMSEINGYELCSILRGTPTHQETPIVFLSMHADHEHRVKSARCGGDDYISKPFLYMELAVKALSLVLRGPWENVGSVRRFTGEAPGSNGETDTASGPAPVVPADEPSMTRSR
ncbi:MAG TPA: response regulator [Verrucomicrobiae bacterium]|nr:response regulator [Verrucomicrobiae bacterium]